MKIYFISQPKHGYTLVDKLPQKGDIKISENGVEMKCLNVSLTFLGGYKYANEDINYQKYEPYTVTWIEQAEDGEDFLERICIER